VFAILLSTIISPALLHTTPAFFPGDGVNDNNDDEDESQKLTAYNRQSTEESTTSTGK
jgi:hypothetical protein